VMYYYGANDRLHAQGVGCATSPDLTKWTECEGNPIHFVNAQSKRLIRPSLLRENNYGTMLLDDTGTNLWVARR